jgi:hypothetical protein
MKKRPDISAYDGAHEHLDQGVKFRKTRLWIALILTLGGAGILRLSKGCDEAGSKRVGQGGLSEDRKANTDKYTSRYSDWRSLGDPFNTDTSAVAGERAVNKAVDACLAAFEDASDRGVISRSFHNGILEAFNKLELRQFLKDHCEVPINYIREYGNITTEIERMAGEPYTPHYQHAANDLGELHDNVGRAYMDRARLRLRGNIVGLLEYCKNSGLLTSEFKEELEKAGWELDSGEFLQMYYDICSMESLHVRLDIYQRYFMDVFVNAHGGPARNMAEFRHLMDLVVIHDNSKLKGGKKEK